jgi:hypothetical protein
MIFLSRDFRTFVGVVTLVLATSAIAPSASYGQQTSGLLRDLPPSIYEFVVHRHLIATLAGAQIKLIDSILGDDGITTDELAALSGIRSKSLEALGILHSKKPTGWFPANAGPPALSGRKIRAVHLVNPRETALWIAARQKQFETGICDSLPGPSKLPDKQSERHNFLLFYIRTVQGLCNTPIDWRPSFRDVRHQPLYEIFSRDTGPIPRDLWFANLHQYLETPSNRPFMRHPKAYIAVYAQYAELAFDARHVSLVNQEFLVRRSDLVAKFVEIEFLQGLFAALLTRRIVG